MVSRIDPSRPGTIYALGWDVRQQLANAKADIEDLQGATVAGPFLPLAGGTMTGALTLAADPAASLQPATKQYADLMVPLAGGTMTGTLANNAAINPFTVSRAATISTGNNRNIGMFGLYSGTYTGGATPLTAHAFNVTGDNVDGGAAGGFYNAYFGHTFGGSNAKGNRTGFYSVLTQTAATGNTGAANTYYVAVGGVTSSTVNDNGTSGTLHSSVFGFNFLARLLAGATYYKECVGGEIDLRVESGAVAVGSKQGIKIVLETADALQGSSSDYAFGIAQQIAGAGNPGFKLGFSACSSDGYWPISTTNGVIIGSETPRSGGPAKQATYGIKFDDVAFTTAAIAMPGFTVDGSGRTTALQFNVGTAAGPNIRAGTGAATGTQPAGSLWLRTDGAVGSRLYVSAGGGTWAAVAGV